jgi:hypothetical protein
MVDEELAVRGKALERALTVLPEWAFPSRARFVAVGAERQHTDATWLLRLHATESPARMRTGHR